MVGPHPFVRSSSLFPNRFVAICLLVLYGAPAAVGPHWHQHGHSCSHGDTSCHVDVSSSIELTSTACGCSHSSDETPISETPSCPAEDGFAATHGTCAVCAFYAQAQAKFQITLQVCSGQLMEPAQIFSISAESARTVYLEARGPPC